MDSNNNIVLGSSDAGNNSISIGDRLRQALEVQQKNQLNYEHEQREKVNRVTKYVDQELEVHLSIIEAKRAVEKQTEYCMRKTEELEIIRNNMPPSPDKERKIEELMSEIARNDKEISFLAQEIKNAEDATTRTQWDNIDSMYEAKFAIKYLFDLLVDLKGDYQNHVEMSKLEHDMMKEAHDSALIDYRVCMEELNVVKEDFNSKITRYNKRQEMDNTMLQFQRDQIRELEEENKRLTEKLQQNRAFNRNLPATIPQQLEMKCEHDIPGPVKEENYQEKVTDNENIVCTPEQRIKVYIRITESNNVAEQPSSIKTEKTSEVTLVNDSETIERIQLTAKRDILRDTIKEMKKLIEPKEPSGSPYQSRQPSCKCRGRCTAKCVCILSKRGCTMYCYCVEPYCGNNRMNVSYVAGNKI